MNIFARNIDLTDAMEEHIIKSLDFLDEFSSKEPSLSLVSNTNEFEFKLTYDIEGKGCTTKIKDVDFKNGVQKLRHKSYKTLMSILRKPISKDTIRKMKPVYDDAKKDDKVKYIEIETLEKPLTQLDAQDIMIERRLSDVLFINMDYENCLTMMHRDKDKFKVYLTDIELN